MSGTFFLAIGLTIALSAAGCRGEDAPIGTALTPSQATAGADTAQLDRKALVGTWRSQRATLVVRDDGTARFAGTRCDMTNSRTWAGLRGARCREVSSEGPFELGVHALTISADRAEGIREAFRLTGYRHKGRLHLADYAPLSAAASRKAGNIKLEVGTLAFRYEGSNCFATPAGRAEQQVACGWRQQDGLDVLTAKLPSGSSLRDHELVYLADIGILASPRHVFESYERVPTP